MGFFTKWREKRAAKKQAKATKESNEVKKVDEPTKKEEVKHEKVVVPKKEITIEEKKEENEKSDSKVAKYHVSQNKDDKSEFFKQWRVRKEGSQKTIKYFQTQVEAITYAEELAEKAGSSIVIHKVDGSIRKQDYTKK